MYYWQGVRMSNTGNERGPEYVLGDVIARVVGVRTHRFAFKPVPTAGKLQSRRRAINRNIVIGKLKARKYTLYYGCIRWSHTTYAIICRMPYYSTYESVYRETLYRVEPERSFDEIGQYDISTTFTWRWCAFGDVDIQPLLVGEPFQPRYVANQQLCI